MNWDWLVGSSGENLYLSYPEDPQSEVTPLTVPANARSKLTGRLGGLLRRGATFGALALARTGTFGGRRGIACRGLVVVGGHGALPLNVAPRARRRDDHVHLSDTEIIDEGIAVAARRLVGDVGGRAYVLKPHVYLDEQEERPEGVDERGRVRRRRVPLDEAGQRRGVVD